MKPWTGPADEAAQATRGSGVRLLAELGGRLFALATSFLLAAGLGVHAFGLFTAISGVAVIVAEVGELGLQATASRALVAGTFSLAAMVRARLALLAALLALMALAPLVAGAAGGSGGADWAAVLPPLILYFGLGGWTEFLGVALRAAGARLSEAWVLLALRAGALVAVVWALQAGASLPVLAWAHVAATVPPLVLAAGLTRRAYRAPGRPDAGQALPAGRQGVLDVLRTSLPLALNGALALLALRVELLAVFALRGAREAGLFGAALKIVESLNGIPTAIAAGAMPALTREALRPPGERGHGVRRRTSATVALFALPAAAGLAVLAPGIVRLLGADYAAASDALRVLAAALVALFMNSLVLHALIAVGRASWLPRLTAARVAFAALLAAALIPRWGTLGAAGGFLAAELLLLVMTSRACAAAGFEVPLVAPLLAAAAVSLPMTAAVVAFGGGTLVAAALGVGVYAATLGAVWWLARDRVVRLMGARA